MSALHIPVLLNEVLGFLEDAEPPRILDGTVGLGGHAEALLDARSDLQITGIDRDEAALAMARKRLAPFGDRVRLLHGNFRDAPALLESEGEDEGITNGALGGVLLDVGVSSLQLDDAGRGFSLREEGPLDMRMDPTFGVPASAWIAEVDEADLSDVLRRYGEERYARRIARVIVTARKSEPIKTTAQLKAIVHRAVPGSYFREPIDPATRTFQAIRIAVNDELANLEAGLHSVFELLAPGGILAVISFHSLEDRIVKTYFRELASDCVCPPDLPDCMCDKRVEAEILTKKPVIPTPEEVASNSRSRSAKLRAARKITPSDA